MTEEYKASPCVGSGLCCKTGPCAYGTWNEKKHQCNFLEMSYQDKEKEVEIYHCGKYEEIKKEAFCDIMPAFGAGCCMGLFNSARSKIIQQYNKGDEKVISIINKRLKV